MILSRDAVPGQDVLAKHLQRVRELGYYMTLIRITAQPPG